ncbi:MAG: PKD domain-containing protein [Tenuifilaceae bacterium]
MYYIKRFVKNILILIISSYSLSLNAQTDTDFWFVVPEITVNHGFPGGIPANLRFATFNLPATITISMPANTVAFPNIVLNVAANSTGSVNLSSWINIAGVEQNKLENKALSVNGINNFGLHITSTSLITAYYEINNSLNTDIWALKGKNALGLDFFTPFQTHGDNGSYAAPEASQNTYSAIDIVATENNTTVWVTPSKNAEYGNAGNTIAAGATQAFTLQKGQTLSIFPQFKSRAKANRLAGSRVTSNKPIAVSLKDDSILHFNPPASPGCRDVAGDQIVPKNVIGVDYIVTRTFLDGRDHIYVVTTEPNTPIYIDGVLHSTPALAGSQIYIPFLSTSPSQYMRISSRLNTTDPYKPIYVFHIGGFGCEQGGAIVPPIDVCTGSTKVAFTRPKSSPFYLTMMVRDNAQDGFLVNGVVRNDLLPPASFTLVGTGPWRVARFGPFNTTQFAVTQHLISNTKDIFHLGIVNGDAGTTCMYGYFSDFNKFEPKSFVFETGGPGNTICYGESSQLFASGGTKYAWTPDDFLDDPFSDSPLATNVTKSLKYKVVVSGVCNLKDSAEIELIVAPYMDPKFTTDVFSGCAPLTVNFTNNSTGVSTSEWDFNSDNDLADPGEGLNNAATFAHVFDNTTNDTIRYSITMLASDASSICFKQVTKTILVYPRISAGYTTVFDPNRCHPLSVTFNNTSTANSSTYSWEFGDGGSSYLTSPTHVYNNFNLALQTYVGSLRVTDKYNYCSVTTPISVSVQPYIKASFVVDKVESCSPFTVNVVDDSQGGFNQSYWDRNGDGLDDYSVSGSWSLPYTNTTVTNTPRNVPIRLRVANAGGCSSTITRTITVNPPVSASYVTDNHGNALGCPPLIADFTSSTTNATIYHWLIDGNAIDNQTTATYTFENFGATAVTKSISFTASNVYGCSANTSQNVIVQPLVNADIAIDQEVGCSPLTVTFLNTSSIGSSAFQWDIDNNGSVDYATTNIPVQIFTNPSTTLGITTIPVKLTARNAAGCTDDIIRNITVNPQSTVSFTYADNGNINHCSPLISNFTSNATNTETYQWQFGTFGASTIANPNFTFSNDGTTDVTVPVTLATNNSFGCPASTAQNIIVRPSVKALFSLDKTTGCPPYDVNVSATTSAAITNYTWDFDGTFFTGAAQIFSNPSNKTGVDINRNIKLTVSSGFCSNEVSKSIVVYPQVEARLTALPLLTGCSPLTVNFQNSSALYGTGTAVNNVVWDFNDNSSSIATTVSHIFTNTDFTNPRTFNVKLTATTLNSCVDDTTFAVTANPSVTAAFNAQIVKQCTPMQIQILNASSAGPTISTYNWNFNGGTPLGVVDDDFIVEYTNPDPENPVNRTISLDLSNTYGCLSNTSQIFSIDPQVVAGLNIALPLTAGGVPIDRLCAPANFTFRNISTGGDLSFTWDFNDGDIQTVSNRNNFAHIFENRTAATKQFDIKLTAKNVKGCTSDATQTVFAYPEVDSKFSMARDSACTPFYLKLDDKSLNGTQWSWNFGHTIGGLPQLKTSTTPGESFTQLIDNESANLIRNYKINLRLDDLTTGCWDTVSQFLEVYPRVISDFTVTPQNGCNPVNVSFINSSTGLGSYIWELDNGLSFNQTTPPNLNINNPSTVNERIVNVKLTAINSLGCKSRISKAITVAPDVKASFTASILQGCDPFTADFSNLTPSSAYNYSWTVNGVQETTNQDFPSRLFENKTNPPLVNRYKILLTSSYKNNAACFDSISRVVTVYPRVYPDFQISNFEACHPLVTNFLNSTVSFNSFTGYSWDLGNGTFSTLKDINNLQYKNNSATKDTTYNIKLVATSVHQCTDEVTKSLTVHPRPIASFIMNNESLSCSPFPVSLTNLSTGVNLNYTFNLGDGTIVNTPDRNQEINHVYHNLTSDVQPFLISLRAVTAFGCDNSTSQTIYSYPEVKANYTFNPGNAACSPFSVSLNNTSNNAYFYQWTFDDGTNSNLMSPTHRFVNVTENDKTYNIKLRSISEYDCEHDTTFPLTVYATPIANFSVDPPLKIYPDATFNFHNQSKPAADSWTYTWAFGDGYTSSLKEPGNHTFATWGQKSKDFIYKSTLRIDAPHCWDTTSNVLRLLPAQPIPFFTADIYESCSPLEAHFINASQYGSNYSWDFGDGTTSTLDEPIHTFTEPGYYNVKLSVFGDGGVTYHFKTFRVYQNPEADFSVFPNRVMLPDATVHVYNLSKFASRYEWDLGDGTLTADKDPHHTYGKLGEFKISLTAYAADSLGACQDFLSKFPAVWVEGVGKIVFPDAFMPSKSGANGGIYDDIDYKNEVFHPVHYGVVEYKLMIFNRWGEQVFQSNDVKIGWDGYFEGKLCDQGVYVWRAIGKYTNGKFFDKKGNITLLR